jgi:diguanylate cyclase (GGDEF)-like protein/PAS domain S-box-containing protein
MTDDATDEAQDASRLIAALRENTRRLVELEELAHIGSWEWDVRDDAVQWSDEMYRLFGLKPDQFAATYEAYLSCLHPDDRPLARSNVELALKTQAPYAADYRVTWPDGELRWLHCRGRAVTAMDGTVVRLIGTTQDVTDRKVLEKRLAHDALHDALTGLPTRSLLRDRLEHAMRRTGRSHHLTAVFFVDIDRFKAINDNAGHHAGDDALRALTGRLRRSVREADTVARYGGDEFVIVAEDLRWPQEASRLAARIQDAASFALPHPAGDLWLSASIGAAVAAAGAAVDEVLRNADVAMYQAKQQDAGSPVVWFDAPGGPSA